MRGWWVERSLWSHVGHYRSQKEGQEQRRGLEARRQGYEPQSRWRRVTGLCTPGKWPSLNTSVHVFVCVLL